MAPSFPLINTSDQLKTHKLGIHAFGFTYEANPNMIKYNTTTTMEMDVKYIVDHVTSLVKEDLHVNEAAFFDNKNRLQFLLYDVGGINKLEKGNFVMVRQCFDKSVQEQLGHEMHYIGKNDKYAVFLALHRGSFDQSKVDQYFIVTPLDLYPAFKDQENQVSVTITDTVEYGCSAFMNVIDLHRPQDPLTATI